MNALPDRPTLAEILRPLMDAVTEPALRGALLDALAAEAEAVARIDGFFERLPEAPRSGAFLACFFNSWRATHLKMLGIYGLSCRLQRLAASAGPAHELPLLRAASHNAGTSHEDLGLDHDGVTHAALYDQFAASFLGNDGWTSRSTGLDDAHAFGAWVYRNMVVEPVEIGLLTNLFSEVYNHAEYTLAYRAFAALIDRHHDFDAARREVALTYIGAHLEDDTEIDHFGLVLEALEAYADATGSRPSRGVATRVFRTYLASLGSVMSQLDARLDA